MEPSAAIFKITEKSTGALCCVIAVKLKDEVGFDAMQVAKVYADESKHPPHQNAQITASGFKHIDFGENEGVRTIEYVPRQG